jgi:hypothetical protein
MTQPGELSVRNGGVSKPVHFMADEADANARLIAAAPETTDALQALLWAVTGFGDFEAQYPEECANARAAIAKATGD